jgi:predicted ATPase/class 3 adenylate cyclase
MPGDLPTGTTTFLFTDVEKSTELARRSGVDYPGLIQTHNRIIAEAVGSAEGSIVKNTGDGVFAVFSSVGEALAAACDLQAQMTGQTWPVGLDVRVRVGVHTGEATRDGDDYVGIDVHRAARVMAAGHGGQVLASETTRSLAGPGFEFRDLGRHLLKGLEQEETIYQVIVPGLPAEFPPLATATMIPNNLPARVASMIGREHDSAALIDAVEHDRLVTILGPGGVGKTSLAISVAGKAMQSFPGGVTFVDISSVSDPEFVVPSIAAEVDADPQTVEGISSRLRGPRRLLVLDNLEQVVDAAGDIGLILTMTDEAHFLVTSQMPLHLEGEKRYVLGPLEDDDARSPAVTLFLERARSVAPDFDADASTVAELVRELDGLPLAIELVAARANLLGAEEMLERIRAGKMSYRPSADAPHRHRSLSAALEWSHDLLEPATQRAFAQLSVFTGGFTLEAAEEVVGVEDIDVIEEVAQLLDRSLVARRVESSRRFGMLDGIRRFARSKLEAWEWADSTFDRFVDFYLELGEEAYGGLQSDRGHWWRVRLDEELDNIRETLTILRTGGRSDEGLGLLGNIWRFFVSRGRLPELDSWISEFLAMPSDGPDTEARIKGIMACGALYYWEERGDAAVSVYQDALSRARDLGDDRLVADAAFGVGTAMVNAGRAGDAGPYLEESKALYERLGDKSGLADVLAGEAFMLGRINGVATTGAQFARAASLYEEAGRRVQFTELLLAQAAAAIDDGRPDDARPLARRGLQSALELADVFLQGWAVEYLARIDYDLGDLARAGRLVGGVETLRERFGAVWSPEIAGLENAGTLLRERLGEDEAERLIAAGRDMEMSQVVELALE